MNRNSQKAVKEIRGSNYETNMPAGERLYRNSEAVYMMRARCVCACVRGVAGREREK